MGRLALPVASDELLLTRLVARDADALAELYDRYGRVVFAVLYRMLPDPEAAEEVCQDTFHRVWKAAGSYRGDRGAVRTWLLSIARNAAIDWQRTKGKRALRETALEGASALASPGSVEDTVHRRLEAGRMRTFVEALPAEQRRCLELAYWGGLTQSEIAERTGAPLGTVKNRVRLGLEKLRTAMATGPLEPA